MDNTKKLLLDILKSFVSFPEDIEINVTEETDERGAITIVKVKVNNADVGLCIGKGGKTAESIRTIVGMSGFKETGNRVYIKVDAPKLYGSSFDGK